MKKLKVKLFNLKKILGGEKIDYKEMKKVVKKL